MNWCSSGLEAACKQVTFATPEVPSHGLLLLLVLVLMVLVLLVIAAYMEQYCMSETEKLVHTSCDVCHICYYKMSPCPPYILFYVSP